MRCAACARRARADLTLRVESATPLRMAQKTKVAALQMTSTEDVERNLASAQRLCEESIAEGAALVVLPECFALLGPEQHKLAIAEPLPEGGPILARFTALARAHKVELVLGGFWE